jgi:hypothetical protein
MSTSFFFATDHDLLQLAGVLLSDPGVCIFERASRPDMPNRQFDTVDSVRLMFEDTYAHFSVWAQRTGAAPKPRLITFNSETQRRLGAKGRTNLESPSLIDIWRNNFQMGCLSASSLKFWTEKGAYQRSIYPEAVLNEVDWKALRSVTGGIQRTIKKLSPARMRAYPIMPDAFRRVQSDGLALWNWGSPCPYPSDLITLA